MITVHDDAGRAVRMAWAARRIVSLVPSLTETLFALGCGGAVVGVTRYCTEPPMHVARISKVGGTKNPDVARIVALRPDVVIVNAEENRQEDFAALCGAGLTVFVSFSHRAADLPALFRRLGQLTDTTAAAAAMAADLEDVLAHVSLAPPAPRRRVFCPIWKNPWMTFNRETYADDMLWIAGGDNVCRGHAQRYPTVQLEDIAALAPDCVLLPDEPYVFAAKDLPALAPLSDTPALRQQRVRFIDGKALSWYGPRTAAGVSYLKNLLDC